MFLVVEAGRARVFSAPSSVIALSTAIATNLFVAQSLN